MPRLSKAELSVMVLLLTLFLSVGLLVDQSRRVSDEVIERAFTSAEDLVDLVVVANRHYIQSVSSMPVNSLTAYPEQEQQKPWLPATFATRYTKSYSDQNPGVDFRIYSRDPFSFNRDRVLDDFAERALDAVLPGGVPDYRAVEDAGDDFVRVRLARAFEMDENCIACHNRPEWGLQNQNWQVGDVRGVWEASILVDPINLNSQAEILGLFMLIVIACILGVFVVLPSVRSEVRRRAFFHDRSVTMERKADQSIAEAHTDALSELGNRRFFDAVFQEMVEDHAGKDQKLAVVIFDIDHFKSVNDTYGHDVGDVVIQSFAQFLREHTREEDKLARFGGEEFVVLVPRLGADAVLAMANRVKNQLQEHVFHADGQSFNVTVSAGIAYLREGESEQSLLKRADQLLYQAKKLGRNRICDGLHADLVSQRSA